VRRALAVVSALALVGCLHAGAGGSDLDTGYFRAVKSWSNAYEIYNFADERAHFNATIESRVFRQQRARERARLLGWPAEVELAEFNREFQESDRETSFILSAYTDVPRENDLGSPKSMWRIALETPAGELLPTRVESFGRPDENTCVLYPYMDRYARAYRVHFAHVSQGPVTLVIASGVGKAELKFDQL
jgi:hypothetical protein